MDDPASLLFLFATETLNIVENTSVFSTALKIFLVIFLVLANGFFVAAEFAFVGVRFSRIKALAEGGNPAAIRLLEILNNLNAYISATQLGITLASLGLGWMGKPAVAILIDAPLLKLAEVTGLGILASETLLQTISFAIAFSIITFLHIVFGELAPKTVALELAERTALALALPMKIFYKVFYYPIRFLNWTGIRTVRLFGLHPSGDHASIYTEEELRHLITLSQQSGHLKEAERHLIHKVFEFSDTTVKEAMIPRTEVVAIPDTCTLEEIAKAFRKNGYSRLPVYRGSLDDMAGVIHSKDLMSYLHKPESFELGKVMHKPMYVVDTARLEDVLRQMQKEKFHFGFVVDEHGGVEGIITLEDLLEEIVGDISDEHDEEVTEQIDVQPDGSCLLEGGLAVRDLNRRLDMNLPVSESYTTIAGFLMSQSGQILSEGDSVPFNGHSFLIEKVDRRRILQVRLERSPKQHAV